MDIKNLGFLKVPQVIVMMNQVEELVDHISFSVKNQCLR